MHTLYRLQYKDIEKASQVLSRSFFDYPDFTYLFSDEGERNKDLYHVMKLLVKCGMLHGEVLAPSNNLEGISIWYKSDQLNFSFIDMVRAGFFGLLIKLNKTFFNTFRELGESKKASRNEIVKGTCYFLDMIGVDPEYRNQGHARIMIEKKLDVCDREKLPCYLSTSSKDNIDFYKKYGFHIIHENNFHEIKLYSMYRESKQ
jgi:hypothetical protein